MAFKINWRSRSNSRSKSLEKDAKYIPAAIIPSAAFIAHPTAPSHNQNLNASQNSLLNSTLNSSVIGLSQENLTKDDMSDEMKKSSSKSRKDKSLSNSQENLKTDEPNLSIRSRLKIKKKPSTKLKSEINNDKDSKRHIEIANGLYDNSNERSVPVKPASDNFQAHIREYEPSIEHDEDRQSNFEYVKSPTHEYVNNDHINQAKVNDGNTIQLKKSKQKSKHSSKSIFKLPGSSSKDNNENVTIGSYHENSLNIKDPVDFLRSSESIRRDLIVHDINDDEARYHNKRMPKIGFQDPEIDTSVRDNFNPHIQSISFDESSPAKNFDNYNDPKAKIPEYVPSQINFNSKSNGLSYPPFLNSHNSPDHRGEVGFIEVSDHTPEIEFLKDIPQEIGFIKAESSSKSAKKQMRSEMRLLQDTIYRLNIELSKQIPSNESGQPIGRTIFPGKGPVPSWLINTKYLAPLFVAHDRKFRDQSLKMQKMKFQLMSFEKELRQIMKENERLHLKLQENQKGGPLSNQSDWQVIIQQAKLVIEENHLLLEELDLQQQRILLQENANCLENAQLKKSLLTVSSERDALDEEIKNLTRRIAGMKGSTQPLNSLNAENAVDIHEESFHNITSSSQVKFYETQIDELKQEKLKNEQEIENLKKLTLKQEKKLAKYMRIMESEKKFRDYFNKVLEKSDEIVNERNSAFEALDMQNKEIVHLSRKLKAEIICRTDLDINDCQNNKYKKNIDNPSITQLNTIEEYIDMMLHSNDELINKNKNLEKDALNYQNLLKEKDQYLQECQQDNDEMEEKLEYLLKNAKNEY